MLGLGLEETLLQYLRAVGWSVTAAVGFAFGVGIALKVFDWLSTDIDEWEEIKKGNMGVSLIFISLIVMVGLLVYKVIQLIIKYIKQTEPHLRLCLFYASIEQNIRNINGPDIVQYRFTVSLFIIFDPVYKKQFISYFSEIIFPSGEMNLA